MCTAAVGFAIIWGMILEATKSKIYHHLPKTGWWHRAAVPVISMMQNFGYSAEPTSKFPNGITDEMARDSYAFLVAICSHHFLSALPMLPVLFYGWENATDTLKSMFILATLSVVGFDIYDSLQTTIRTFTKHGQPVPLDYWIVIVALHHTASLLLVFPMNVYYPHRVEYHQTAVSLLMAAALCYGVGCWKFALDLGKGKDFFLYKLAVLFQLGTILYTRVYLWFPAAISFRNHLKEQAETSFFYVAILVIGTLSIFNLILVADAVKAAIKCIPKGFPKTASEKEKVVRAFRRTSSLDVPGLGGISESMYSGASESNIKSE